VNRSEGFGDNVGHSVNASSITVMEILAMDLTLILSKRYKNQPGAKMAILMQVLNGYKYNKAKRRRILSHWDSVQQRLKPKRKPKQPKSKPYLIAWGLPPMKPGYFSVKHNL
jgi:predicted SnoaL-like aldol condensation-catalyzing enzyme